MFTSQFAQVGDVGVAIIVQVVDQSGTPIDISAATGLTIKLEYPDRSTSVDKTAVLVSDGLDGKMKYVTEAGVLSQAGEYLLQGKVTLGTGPVSTRKGALQVFENVDDN